MRTLHLCGFMLALVVISCKTQKLSQPTGAAAPQTAATPPVALTIINNSGSAVFFQLFATDIAGNPQKHTSLTTSIAARSTISYQSFQDLQWEGEAPLPAASYTGVKGTFVDASGGCTAEATNIVGTEKYNFKNTASINTTTCGGAGSIKLQWNSDKNNLTINTL